MMIHAEMYALYRTGVTLTKQRMKHSRVESTLKLVINFVPVKKNNTTNCKKANSSLMSRVETVYKRLLIYLII